MSLRRATFLSSHFRRRIHGSSSSSTEKPASPKRPLWKELLFSILPSSALYLAKDYYDDLSADELEAMTQKFRDSVKYIPDEGATCAERFKWIVYSTTMAVPAKVLEVCINVKRIDESNQTKIWDFILTKPIPESPPLPFQLALVPVSRLADYIQSAKRRDEFFTRPGIDDLLLCFSTFYESMDEVDSMRYLDENIKCLWSNLKKAKKPFFLLCGPEVQNCLHGESYLLIKKRNLEDNEENALTFTSMDVLAYVAITCPGSVRLVLRSYNGMFCQMLLQPCIKEEGLNRSPARDSSFQQSEDLQRGNISCSLIEALVFFCPLLLILFSLKFHAHGVE